MTALDRVRSEVLWHFDHGMLGVLAAKHNIAEGKLRAFACGDDHALTVDEAVSIALAISKQNTDRG